MGLLGYAMLNNGVHWASDYPVGIALGYAFAKIAVRNGRTRVEVPADSSTARGTGFRAQPPAPALVPARAAGALHLRPVHGGQLVDSALTQKPRAG